MVRVALLGAGLFAQAYLPIIQNTQDCELVAIWTRSEDTLQNVLQLART